MERIDFYRKKKDLHNEMLQAIVALFDKAGLDEIDFMPEGEWQRNAYVLYCPDGAYSIQEFQVHKVRCVDGLIEVLAEDDEDEHWISCEHAGDIMTDSLDSLYEAVYDAVADINFVYYVCELDEDGNPTGKVTKETWRLEYADNMIESRGFIYHDLDTALLNAQYDKKKVKHIV